MLTIRQRGTFWHARGTVKAAGKSVYLKECSTGETQERLARSWVNRKQVEIENDLREGRAVQSGGLTFGMAALRFSDTRTLNYRDKSALAVMTDFFFDDLMVDLGASRWAEFMKTRGRGSRPASASTADRYLYMFRCVFDAVKGEGIKRPEIDSPRTAKARRSELRARWLTTAEADKLIGAYDERVRPIATLLRYQGFRTQECLQIDRRHVDMKTKTIFIDKSKNGFARTVSMHPKTFKALKPLMKADRIRVLRPGVGDFEPLFLTSEGEPYQDTRDKHAGNPLKSSHASACKRAKIMDFTPHDWRRHWACTMLKAGVDPWLLLRMGGWSDLKSIEPYVQAVSRDMDRQSEALRRVS